MDSERRLTTDDGSVLWYWIQRCEGDASTPVLLIHGAASNHSRWSEFIRLTTLGKHHDLVRPDMRGNARSMWRGKLDLAVWSRDLAAILDAEGYQSTMVIGHSLGAQIALQLAADHPQRVRALALIDPVVRQALIGKRKRLRQMEPLIRLGIGILQALNGLGLRKRQFPMMDLETLDAETRAAMQGEHPQRELVQRYSALGPILQHMPIANYLQQVLATIAPLPQLERITAPALVLESTGVDFMDRACSRAELARLPRLTLIEIDATHWPLTERPDEVRRAIEGWIEQLKNTQLV